MRKLLEKINPPDMVFVVLFTIVVVFGIVMLSSVSTAIAYERFGDSLYYLKHQLFYGFIPGVIICTVISFLDYRIWKKFAFPLYLASIGLLLAVFIPGLGATFGGSRSWIGLGGLTFQPAEVVKFSFILYLSAWLNQRNQKTIKDFSGGFMPFLTSLGIVMFLILLQPDVGTMSVIVMIALMIYFVAGADLKHLFGFGAAGVVALGVLIKAAPYRAARFMVFMHPELDPQGIGYHINQALLAIGSGGLVGLGFGHSRQKHLYLPEVIGDSIFAIIAEELGFIVVVVILALFLAMMIRGYQIAQRSTDNFAKYVITGVISWVGFQTFINIAAMVGLVPITGLPLPFVSYGSSSLLALFGAMGIVINMSRFASQPTTQKSKVIHSAARKHRVARHV